MKILISTLLSLAACGPGDGGEPTPTETVCPSPDPNTLTYENFGRPFMEKYCTQCHASTLPRSMRNGAPLFHDFDSLLGVLQVANHIDEQAGHGPNAENSFMPPARCPAEPGEAPTTDCMKPSAEERRNLALWLACEVDRPRAVRR
ncbi:MAG: hypothetical protein H0T89_09260 [Deltaproteobacteria bacterium]|nr:hypothetical protein [Deltaproteobacteria bacterium]MDQ3295946.1 hypothetical protein [Myxococcota bacterium]